MNCPECGQFYDGKSCDHKKGASTPQQEYPQGKRSDAAQALLEGPLKLIDYKDADEIFKEPVAVKRKKFTFTFDGESFKTGHFENDHLPAEVKRRKALALYAINAVESGEIKVNLTKKDGRVVSGAVMFYKELPPEIRKEKAFKRSRYIIVFTDSFTGRITDIRTYYDRKSVHKKHDEVKEGY